MAHATEILLAHAGFTDRLIARVDALKDRFTNWSLYRKTVRELSQLSDRELNDLGIARGSLPFVARMAVYGN